MPDRVKSSTDFLEFFDNRTGFLEDISRRMDGVQFGPSVLLYTIFSSFPNNTYQFQWKAQYQK